MRARYEPPNDADWRALLTSSDMHGAVEAAAEAAKSHAESIAPVDSGEYRDSFRVESEVFHDRATAYLVNDAPHAGVIEFADDGDKVLSRTADWLEGGG